MLYFHPHQTRLIWLTWWSTYLSDEGSSDGLVLKAGVGELFIVVVRRRPIVMVTRTAGRGWWTTKTGKQFVFVLLSAFHIFSKGLRRTTEAFLCGEQSAQCGWTLAQCALSAAPLSTGLRGKIQPAKKPRPNKWTRVCGVFGTRRLQYWSHWLPSRLCRVWAKLEQEVFLSIWIVFTVLLAVTSLSWVNPFAGNTLLELVTSTELRWHYEAKRKVINEDHWAHCFLWMESWNDMMCSLS